jgi:hypothetical protein
MQTVKTKRPDGVAWGGSCDIPHHAPSQLRQIAAPTDDGPGMRIAESGAPSRQIDGFEEGSGGPAFEILEIADGGQRRRLIWIKEPTLYSSLLV